jgi:hypothetical protein
LEDTANHGNWRSDLVISVELEKPERENIEELVPRVSIMIFTLF